MRFHFKYSIRGLTRHPLRSLLTIMMLTIANALICGTIIALNNIPSLIEATVKEANMADFSLSMGLIPRSIVEEILSKRDYIEDYELRLLYRTTVYNPRGWPREADILLIGVDLPLKMNNVVVVKGRMPEGDEEAIIAEYDYGENVLGRQILIETSMGNITVNVVGACRAIWMPRWYGSSIVYAIIPIQVLQRILNVGSMINHVLIKAKDGCNVFDVIKELSEEFKKHRIPVSESIEGNVVPFIEIRPYYNYLVSLLSLIGFSIFAIGMALIYTSMNLMVTREFKDIGILRALGASNAVILSIYAFRGLIFGSFSGILGSFLGISIANALLSGFVNISQIVEGVYFVMISLLEMLGQHGWLMIAHILFGVVCSVISALPPIISVMKIPVIQAIKSFPGLSLMKVKAKARIENYPYFMKYALRSFMRKRSREVIIAIVMAVSVTINSVLIVAYETQQSILDETSRSLNFDLILCLNRPYDKALLMNSLKPFMDSIDNLEFVYYRYVKANEYTILTLGLPFNATCFKYPLVDGEQIREEGGVILPENLAQILNVKVGDYLTLVTESSNVSLTVVGIRRDPIFNAIITLDNIMYKLDAFSEGKVNAMAIKFKENADINSLVRSIRRSVRGRLWDIDKSGVINILSDILTRAFQSAAITMMSFTWMTSILLIFAISGQDIIEERVIIATLRALGMSRAKCIFFIVFKMTILGALSAIICLFSIPITLDLFSKFLSSITPFSIHLNPSSSVLFDASVFILSTVLPSSLILGGYVASTNISSTLRYE